MKINNVKCTQFGGIRKNENIDFQDGINIIYGKNETGKSTLINLIYSLLWRKSKVKGSKEDKEFKKNFFPSELKDGKNGKSVEGILEILGEDGKYTIDKLWSENGIGKISTPKARLNENDDMVDFNATLKELLKYDEGIYREIIFTNQKNFEEIISSIFNRSLKTNISDIATSTLLDMGGVSPDKFLEIVNNKINEINEEWDNNLDKPNFGKENAVKNIGLQVKEYKKLVTNNKKVSDFEDLNRLIEEEKEKLVKINEKIKNKEEDKRTFDNIYNILVNRKSNEELLNTRTKELGRLKEASEEWPKLEQNIVKAVSLNKELDIFVTKKKWHDLCEINSKIENINLSINNILKITKDDIDNARCYEISIRDKQNKLDNFSALLSASVSEGYNLVIREKQTGKDIEFRDGDFEINGPVEIEIPGIFKLDISSAKINTEEILNKINEEKQKLDELLNKYKADSVNRLDELNRDNIECEVNFNRQLKNLESEQNNILYGINESELEKSFKEIENTEVRDITEINRDIEKLLEGNNLELLGYIKYTSQEINSYKNEFSSIDDMNIKIEDLKIKIEESEKEIRKSESIPEEYLRVNDPKRHKELLEDELQQFGKDKERIISQHSSLKGRLEKMEEAQPYEDLLTEIEENKNKLNEHKIEYNALKKIKDYAEEILNEVNDNPIKELEDNFKKYLSFLSSNTVTLENIDKSLNIDIYSGNNKMSYEILSQGTKAIIALAFRFALIEYLFPEGNTFVVLDDPLSEMDAERKEKSCELIKEFSKQNQVIFTTCDEQYIEMLGGNIIDISKIS